MESNGELKNAKKRRVDHESVITESRQLSDQTIFYEIFPRLPVDSLCRFKSVCKEWCKVIETDPIFKASQIRRSVSHPSGLLYRGHNDEYMFLDPSLKCNKRTHFKDFKSASNGIICSTYKKNGMEYFCVTNPATKESVSVPNLHGLENIALVYEPSYFNPHFAIVAWYAIGEYTTVCFSIYSSETRTWSATSAEVILSDTRGVLEELKSKALGWNLYVGGTVYWRLGRLRILWFNIKDDSGGSITVPNYNLNNFLVEGELGDCNGELSYSMVSGENMEIWVLQIGNGKDEIIWVPKYSVSFTEIFKDYYGKVPSCCNASISKLLDTGGKRGRSKEVQRLFFQFRRPMPFEGEDLRLWVEHGEEEMEGVVLSYNMKTKSLGVVHDTYIYKHGDCFLPFKWSLSPLPLPYRK